MKAKMIKLPQDTADALKVHAAMASVKEQRRISENRVIIRAINEYLKNHNMK